MDESRRVLLLGSSEVTFTEAGPEESIAGRLEAALRERAPEVDWEIVPYVTYAMANMPERTLQLVERHSPDLVVLWLAGNVFAERTLTFALYHRSRRAYDLVTRLTGPALKAAGGGSEGTSSLRGALFRLPRAAATRVLGSAPFIPPDVAREATSATLEALHGRGQRTVCRLAYPNSRQAAQAASVRRLVEEYNVAVEAVCERLGIPSFRPEETVETTGRNYAMLPDGLHSTLETRQITAAAAADFAVRVLGLPSISGAA